MSKRDEYYPKPTDLMIHGYYPCLKCGALISSGYLGLHVEWHERQGR